MIDVRSSFPILYVASVAKSLAFYRDLLGFRVAYTFPPGDDPGFASLCLSESGDILDLPRDRPWGERVAFVADPDGNPVHLRAPISA